MLPLGTQSNNTEAIRNAPCRLSSSLSSGKANVSGLQRSQRGRGRNRDKLSLTQCDHGIGGRNGAPVGYGPRETERSTAPTLTYPEHIAGVGNQLMLLLLGGYRSITESLLTNTRWLELVNVTHIRWSVNLHRFQKKCH